MTPYRSRKFLFAVATVASATGLVYFGHIADGVYSAVTIATVTAYLAANVTQKWVQK
ncbi:MAG TPA: hypothetical protein P5305_04045 [Rubrivivax sp.]|nr:hypothetical protein [Rubrivivax sp.]HRY87034.1 hypothetical protein [Rubrivivax sp.]